MIPSLAAVTLPTGAALAARFASMGIFNRAAAAAAGLSEAQIEAALSSVPSGDLHETADGWVVITSEAGMAMETVMRIAGALDHAPVPLSDIARAMLKAMSHGKYPGFRRHPALGRAMSDWHSAYPSNESVAILCRAIGATVDGNDRADFAEAEMIIRPVGVELDLLNKLSMRTRGHAPASWLARRLDNRPSRTTVDGYVSKIPFIIRDEKRQPVRLLGRQVGEGDLARPPRETYVNMRRSRDGRIVALEFNLTEEAVESNSFNIPASLRSVVRGRYHEIGTGTPIVFDDGHGRDARKLFGVGSSIRKAYPNYENGETAFVFLDRASGTARIEVGLRHDQEFEGRVGAILGTGIHGQFPMAA